jgi:uncharacterized protein (TIGR03000 family)
LPGLFVSVPRSKRWSLFHVRRRYNMLRRVTGLGGLLLLVAAVVFATPGTAQAQRWHGGYYGGWGGYHGGYGGWYGGYPSYGWGYGSPYASWGSSYPSSSYWSDPYYGTYAYTYPSTSYQSFSYSPSTGGVGQPANTARVLVRVPTDAQVWFNDTQMTSTGSVREFVSPPLTAEKKSVYDIRARWMENGREVTQTKTIDVTPGARVQVDFPKDSITPASIPPSTPSAPVPELTPGVFVPGQTAPTPVTPGTSLPRTVPIPLAPAPNPPAPPSPAPPDR